MVEGFAVIWSLWLCRKDKIFNDKRFSYAYHRSVYQFALFMALSTTWENRYLFMKVCTWLKDMARDIFIPHGWWRDLAIGPLAV
jgi:hypothetical protein